MNIQCVPSSLFPERSASRRSSHQQSITLSFKSSERMMYINDESAYCHLQGKTSSKSRKVLVSVSTTRTWKCLSKLGEEPATTLTLSKKKGTIAGAVALIIGTTIGSGILALPRKTSPAGLLPSSITITACWAFLLIEALLLVEINVGLLRKKKRRITEEDNDQLEVISLRTMAQETLGEWGGALATVTYVFLGYTSMVAYTSKSGEILYNLINLPKSILGFFFTVLFTLLISVGGTRATDRVNQWLTVSMIGLLVAIEVLAIVFGGWAGLEGAGDWGKVPATIPVIIFSLVYHDLAPVLCAYLGGDLQRIRTSVLLGSAVPLLALLVWDAIALSLSSQSAQVADPVDLLMSVRWSGVSIMVEAFSLLAIGTSMIGTLLGFSEFFKEQLGNFSFDSPSTRIVEKPEEQFGLKKWWGRNKVGFAATAMVIAPPLFVSTTVPDAFSAATDLAGGYCMTTLYGVLPPAMTWAAMNNRTHEEEEEAVEKTYHKAAISAARPAEEEEEVEKTYHKAAISAARPALLGVGLFACGIIVEQILQDFSTLHL